MFCLGVAPGDSLRRTVQVLIRREPAQNTTQTHEQVYVLRDPATRPEAE